MKEEKKAKIIKNLKDISIYVIIIIAVIIVKRFIVAPIRVNGDSMNDTLKNGDIMILNKASYSFEKIKRFDIVVVSLENEKIIKRIIGLPGETVKYENNILYINNKRVEENFDHKRTEDFKTGELGIKKIPNDMYLVVGDNRTNSLDSRTIGYISKDRIVGKTSLTIFPLNRLGIKK